MRHELVMAFIAAVLIIANGNARAATVAQPSTYVTTADVHLRSGPGTNYQTITTIPRDVRVSVVGQEGAWLKIESKHGGKPGYIEASYARPLAQQNAAQAQQSGSTSAAGAYRTVRETELREGPGTNYGVITRLPADIRVNVVRAEGDWLRVESKRGGKPGYVDRRSVERDVK